MAKMIMDMDVDKQQTKLHRDGEGKFGKIARNDLAKMGEITKIDHATIIYHKSNPSAEKCVTIILNGILTRFCG